MKTYYWTIGPLHAQLLIMHYGGRKDLHFTVEKHGRNINVYPESPDTLQELTVELGEPEVVDLTDLLT
jgi:hypothetical protein